MDPNQDDFTPAGSIDAGGTLYRAAHDDSGSARVLPPGPMSPSSYVDESKCLIIVSSLPVVFRNVLVSRHLLVSACQE
jgi:hypothetical protein